MKKDNTQTLWERRDRLMIMAEIMEAAKEGQGKTRLMYKVNLSFSQVNEYLSFLTEKGFLKLTVRNKKRSYETTQKGSNYIENYTEMANLLKRQQFEAQIAI